MTRTLKFFIYMLAAGSFAFASADSPKARKLDFVAPAIGGKSTIPAPQSGLIIFDTTDNGFYINDNQGQWVSMSNKSSDYLESTLGFTAYNSIGSCAADVWCDLTSITVPAGDWEIQPQVTFRMGTGISYLRVGVSTTSGNSSTGLNPSENLVGEIPQMSVGNWNTLNMAPFRVTPNGSTTYYLKAYSASSVTSLQVAFRISARRYN